MASAQEDGSDDDQLQIVEDDAQDGDRGEPEVAHIAAGTIEDALQLEIGEKRPDFGKFQSPAFSFNYFWRVPGKQVAICLACRKDNMKSNGKVKKKEEYSTSGGATSGLGEHVRKRHPPLGLKFDKQQEEVDKLRAEYQASQRERKQKKQNDNMRQLKLVGSEKNVLMTNKPEVDKKLQEKWDNNNVLYASKTLVSFKSLEKTGILLRTFWPPGKEKVKIRSSHTISVHTQKYAGEIRDWIYSIVMKQKEDHKLWCFTIDLWSDHDKNSFFGLTLHYCDTNFVMRRLVPFVSSFPESHTGVNIRLKVTEFIKQLGLDSEGMRRVITCDNDSGNKAALRVMKENDDELEEVYCCLHTLALTVKDAFVECVENIEVAEVALRCQQLATFIRASKDRRDTLRAACEKTNTNFVLVSKYCETRWNAKFDTMESVIRLREALLWIGNQAAHADWRPKILTPLEFESVDGVCKILKHFKIATKMIESEKTASICEVLPQLYNLRDVLTRFSSSESLYIASFSQLLLQKLDDRFPMCGTRKRGLNMRHGVREMGGYNIYINMAHYPDCRWRGVVLEEFPPALQNTKEEIVKMLSLSPERGELEARDNNDTDENEVANLSAMERLAKRRRMSGDNNDDGRAAAAGTGGMSLLQIEFHAFENMTIESNDNLMFWKSVKDKLPNLSKAARMVFSVMPSSAPVERVFSVSGRAKDRKRARLNSDSLESLTIINMNQDYIEDIRANMNVNRLKMPKVSFPVEIEENHDENRTMAASSDEEDFDEQEEIIDNMGSD